MGGGNEVTRNLLQQEPGRNNRHANAAAISNVALQSAKCHNSGTPYRVTPSAGDAFRIVVKGRDRWALEELRKAGLEGITSYTNPASRLSAYIHNLRQLGLEIETVSELHGGDFAGHHERYILRSTVTPERMGGAQ